MTYLLANYLGEKLCALATGLPLIFLFTPAAPPQNICKSVSHKSLAGRLLSFRSGRFWHALAIS